MKEFDLQIMNKKVKSYGPENVEVYFIKGPIDGQRAMLAKTPDHVLVSGFRYDRIDDPDTGEFIGAYSLHYEGEFNVDYGR